MPDRTVDVINESGVTGQARLVLDAAVAEGYRAGLVSSGVPRTGSVVDYAAGDSAVGGGWSGPPPTALTDLSGGGIPCVK